MSHDYKKGDIIVYKGIAIKETIVIEINLINPHVEYTIHFIAPNKQSYGTHVSNIMRLATEREAFFFHLWGPYNLKELKKES